MADGTIGRLVVEMSANLARFESDMRSSVRITEQAMSQMTRAADTFGNSLKTAFGTIAAGFTAGALLERFRTITDGLDALSEASERTGAAVERLSSLQRTLAPYGGTLQQIEDISTKLIRTMRGTEEETSKAAAAYQSLGIAVKDANGDLREPTVILEEVAKALTKYADGANKTAIAQALLGKSGAEYLPLLKDLAEAQVKAGTVTAEQAEAAKRFNEELRTLKYESGLAAQSLVSSLIPAFNDLLSKFNQARGAGLGMVEALKTIPGANSNSVDLLRLRQAEVAESQKQRADLLAQSNRTIYQGSLGQRRFGELLSEIDQEIARRQKLVDVIKSQIQQAALLGRTGDDTLDARDLRLRGAQSLPQAPQQPDLAEEKRRREEAERARLKAEEEARKLAEDRMNLRLRNDPTLRLFDEEGAGATKQTREELDKWTESQGRAADAVRAKLNPALAEYEAAIKAANEATFLDPEERQAAIEKARIAFTEATAALDPYNKMLKELRDAYQEILTPQEQYAKSLREIAILEKEGLGDEQGLRLRTKAAEDYYKAMDKAAGTAKDGKDVAKEFGLIMSSEAERAIAKWESLGAFIRGLLADVAKFAIRKTVTEPTANLVSKGISALGNYFVGQFGTTPDVTSDGWVSAEGRASYRASGGPVSAGMPYIVGEQGPELFIPGASGAIASNSALKGDTYYIDARGADSGQLARLESMIRAIGGSVKQQAIAAWSEQRAKGGDFSRA